jgi:hypothetical protein
MEPHESRTPDPFVHQTNVSAVLQKTKSEENAAEFSTPDIQFLPMYPD